jgi:hypothetical protein
MELESAMERRDLEVDMVSNLELKVSSTVICVALLSALGNPQILSYLSDSLLGLLDLSRAKEHSLSYLRPHQRGSALPPVQGLKW